MSRLSGATDAIRQIVFEASDDIVLHSIGEDHDLIEDLGLKTLELVSVGLMIEEVFFVAVPDGLFETPLYRTPAALAEWVLRQTVAASYAEARRQRRA